MGLIQKWFFLSLSLHLGMRRSVETKESGRASHVVEKDPYLSFKLTCFQPSVLPRRP